MASEFLHLRRQLEHELEAWTFAAHTVDRLGGGGGCGNFRSPEEARAAASKHTGCQVRTAVRRPTIRRVPTGGQCIARSTGRRVPRSSRNQAISAA